MSGQSMSGQLSLDDMPARLVRVTPARLGVWDDCRRRFRLVYLDRPAPPRAGARAPSTLGATVHNVLRALFLRPAPARTPDRAAALLDRLWSDEGFRDAGQAARHRARARDWVSDYAAAHGTVEPLGVERWVSAGVGALVAEGRVDRIDPLVREGEEAVIVDYKTGRHAPDSDDARAAPALALYALATARTLRRTCRRVELHHLPTGRIAVAEHDDVSLRRHRDRAEASAAAMTAVSAEHAARDGGARDALFPPSPGPRCGSCDVRRHCPEGRAAAPELASWELLAP